MPLVKRTPSDPPERPAGEAVVARGAGRRGGASGRPSRRRLLWIAVVVVAILVFAVLPGVLAAQPWFFGKVPGLRAQYEPWASSTHAEARCEACHVPPATLTRAAYRVRLVGEFYLSFLAPSRKPPIFKTPTNQACLVCHSDLRTVSPKGDLQIPHRAHVNILKMDCVTCHKYLVHELSPEGKHTPRMVDCLTCHDGDTAKDACTACHTQKAAPASHKSGDWLVTHADEADDPECVTCHKWRADWCVDCHKDRPRSHGADWRAVHGERVAEHRNCEACHGTGFCARCHGELPSLNFDPTLRLVE